jgi:phosphoribosyl 1,2-cyclic phosphodiesterase
MSSTCIFFAVAIMNMVLEMFISMMCLGVCVQSLAVIKKLQPKRAFLVGMTHEFEHELDTRILAEWSSRCSS